MYFFLFFEPLPHYEGRLGHVLTLGPHLLLVRQPVVETEGRTLREQGELRHELLIFSLPLLDCLGVSDRQGFVEWDNPGDNHSTGPLTGELAVCEGRHVVVPRRLLHVSPERPGHVIQGSLQWSCPSSELWWLGSDKKTFSSWIEMESNI